jgi:hypothetical protein
VARNKLSCNSDAGRSYASSFEPTENRLHLKSKGEMKMRKLFILATLVLAGPALAADLSTGTVLGTTQAEVQAKLIDMGYEVRKSEMEDGKIEVYFIKDKKMGEIYVSTATGKVTRLKMK